jgi:spore germination protein YaaH
MPRAALAGGLALLIAATAAPVSARPGATAVDPAAGVRLEAEGVTQDLPSVHWLHEQEHGSGRFDFEPGERVTVPFSPRRDDTWEIDGKAPRALPAGHATGRQMRDAAQGSIWAAGKPGQGEPAGPPTDAASPDAGAGSNVGIDQPTSPVDAVADPAGFSASSGSGGVEAAAPVGPNGLRREVFGFLPYWELSDSSTVLDWRVLSTVAYFSVGCRGNGDLHKRNSDGSLTTGWAGWTSSKMTSVINAAHQSGSRVVLTVTCFAWSSSTAQTQAALLGSSTARANLAKQIAAAVRDRGADGVNLDFEPIVSGYSDEYVLLIKRVRSELNNVAPGYQLTFDTIGSLGSQPIVEGTAAGAADAVFIMGYDYRTASAGYAGSIAPLTGPRYDLADTVKAYAAKISPSKIILGVPWYGRAWSTASDAPNARTLDPAKYGSSAAPLYVDAIEIAQANGRRWDSVEQSAWTAYRRQTCTSTYGCVTSWRELYYDDAQSLKLKYDLVNRQSLRGVGIWALGFDDARTELRTALADKFLVDKSPPLVGVTTLAQAQRDEAFKVAWASWDDSSIKGYDVEVSVDGGAWSRWRTATTATSALYQGRDGATYAFRARATDVHGNVAAWSPGSTTATAASAEIAVGGFATVLADGLRMRASASTGASIMTTLAAGDALQVIGGPTVADGYTWFQVSGPVRQWNPVDAMQVGGWIAAFGNGVENAGPRRPVYATKVDAGITGLHLNDGGLRVLTPGGDLDPLKVEWTNHVAFDTLALRVYRLDGSVAGSVGLGGTGVGAHAFNWDGRVGGTLLPAGSYVLQLQGHRGSTAYHAPSAAPTADDQAERFGVIVGPAAPTSVVAFAASPASPTRSGTLTFGLTFGGAITGLTLSDVVRGGTATGCSVAAPTGSGAGWSIKVSGCGAGTVTLTLKAKSVRDAVANWGPGANVGASALIDRAAPKSTAPRTSLRSGVSLASTSTSTALLASVAWSASDAGGAGIRDFDVRRSVDGGAWKDVAVDTTATSLLQSLAPNHSYRYQVRARDRAGNVGAWVAGPTFRAYLRQEARASIAYGGTWRTATQAGSSGGAVRHATSAGASVRYTFSGRAIAVVSTLGPDRGDVRVYLDGTYVTTISTQASALSLRRVVFSKTWSTAGTHTLRLVVVGTAGHPRFDLDALEVLW